MKTKYLLTLLSLAVSVIARPVTLDVTAGSLESAASNLSEPVTSLTLTGSVNATDLHYIATSMSQLTTLDLSGVTIAADNNIRLATNHTVYPAATLPAYILAGSSVTEITLPADLKAIGDGALMSTRIKSLTIPASVTAIGQGAFADCTALTEVTVPATVTSLGSHTFDGCTALNRVNFLATDVPDYAFRGCTALTDFKGKVTTVGANAFAGCTALQSFPFPDEIRSVGESAFYKSGLTAVNASGSSLRSIGAYAFAYCPSLTSVSLPECLSSLGEGAFFHDSAIDMVSYYGTIGKIADFTFKGVSSLADGEHIIPVGIDFIGRYSLAGMTSVRLLTIPATVSHISDNAMQAMTGLESIGALELNTVPTTGSDVWAGVDQPSVKLYVSPDMENAFIAAPQWNRFSIETSGISTGIADPADNPAVTARLEGAMLYIESESALIADVAVYTVTGQLLEMRSGIGEPSVEMDLGRRSEPYFIVSVRLEGEDRICVFKLARV